MKNLLETAELAGYENMTYRLKNYGVPCIELVYGMADETIRGVIDSELVDTRRVRDLWEQLGEPDPEFLDHCISISHAIGIAVDEAIYSDEGVSSAVNDGIQRALTELAREQGIYTEQGDTVEELLERLEYERRDR